jgi:UDP-3-O-acyl N-acetylglucosamine deacetylase
MYPTRNQRTVASPARVDGFGYWSGLDVRLEFRPAPPDTGIVFVRTDLEGRPRIAAAVANRTQTPLRTSLRWCGVGVDMVEHALAALAGLEIDNCEVWADQQEMPGLDGSSLPFVEALTAAGIVEQPLPRRCHRIDEVIRRGDEESWIEVQPCSSARTVIQYELDYGAKNPIGRQSLEVHLSPKVFARALAPCRTFLLEREAAALQAKGLGRRATFSDLLVFGASGPIDNKLRFPDECVRHKIVDLIGDMALAGCDLVGRFVAHRSGHRLNAELVRAILAAAKEPTARKRCA